jgi:hypothetical protein
MKWSDDEIKQLRGLVKKFKRLVTQSEVTISPEGLTFSFTGRVDKHRADVTITPEKTYLRCRDCRDNNIDPPCGQDEVGKIFVCPNLPQDLISAANGRLPASSKKVGRFLYKKIPNKSGNYYWYLQWSENGKPKSAYLGAAKPEFDPEKDLERIKAKKNGGEPSDPIKSEERKNGRKKRTVTA